MRFSPIRGEIKPFQKSTATKFKRQAQQYHDKLQGDRWEQDKLGVKPKYTWDEAAAKFLLETSHKRTHEWDKSMLRWFQLLFGGEELIDINRALLDQVRAARKRRQHCYGESLHGTGAYYSAQSLQRVGMA